MKKSFTLANIAAAICLSFFSFQQSLAQDNLDNSFGNNGIVLTDFGGTFDEANDIALQPDGKIVVAGKSDKKFTLVRYLPDGDLDTTFGANGWVKTTIGAFGSYIHKVLILPDGKIVAFGDSKPTGGSFLQMASARYEVNGMLDTTFGNNGIWLYNYYSWTGFPRQEVVLQSDGKLLVGFTDAYDEGTSGGIFRCHGHGAIDTTFLFSELIGGVASLSLQLDGKILVGTKSDGWTGRSASVLRLNPDGNLDSLFGTNGMFKFDTLNSIHFMLPAIQPDGKYMVAAQKQNQLSLLRLNDDGTLDETFGNQGALGYPLLGNEVINGLALHPDNRIILSSRNWDGERDFTLRSYLLDGSPDLAFGDAGLSMINIENGSEEEIRSLALTQDGKIVVAGYHFNGTNRVFALARYLLSEILYVDKDATGANNGSSWQDAFTDLQVAIAAAEEGDQIWVAEGIYLPGDTTSATFFIDKNIKLYGGFSGVETSLGQRDWNAHLTLLSGDVNGDDVENDFTVNRTDNIQHIVKLTDAIDSNFILDGFIIKGGHASGVEKNGGGIFSTGKLSINNCVFKQNFAENAGGGIFSTSSSYLSGLTGSLDNCKFESNAARLGGGIAMSVHNTGGSIEITNSTFTDNIAHDTGLGGGLAMFVYGYSSSLYLDHCVFSDNIATQGGGVLLSFGAWQPHAVGLDAQFQHCEFINNKALPSTIDPSLRKMGGGMGIIYNISSTDIHVSLDSCNFHGNTSSSVGGALGIDHNYGWGNSTEITGCTFTENEAVRGGAINSFVSGGDDYLERVTDCTFTGNKAIPIPNEGEVLGGAYHNQRNASNNILIISTSEFNQNNSDGSAGALAIESLGTDNQTTVTHSSFLNNQAAFYGGGIQSFQNGSQNYSETISNCTFSNNYAGEFGGGYRMAGIEATSTQLQMRDCVIDSNEAGIDAGGLELVYWTQAQLIAHLQNVHIQQNTATNDAGGLNFYLGGGSGNGQLTLDHCRINGNINSQGGNLEEGGGGVTFINFGDGESKMNILSSVIENNEGDGTGGILVYNDRPITSTIKDSLFIINSLIAGNVGGEWGGGVSVNGVAEVIIMESTIADNTVSGISLASKSYAHLRNTILHNPGYDNYLDVGNNTSIISYGGVLSGDHTLDGLLGASDISKTDPLFLSSGDFPYQLAEGSPAIDAAVPVPTLPTLDLAGNARVQGSKLDIGAYESPFVSSLKEKAAVSSVLSLSPNPATDKVQLTLKIDWRGAIQVQIMNVKGQVVKQFPFDKNASSFIATLDLSDIEKGTYFLLVTHGDEMVMGEVIKI